MDKIDDIFALTKAIRYVAVYEDGNLSKRTRADAGDTSDDESDTYEELLVNPTLLKLVSQRGNIDCGGLSYVIIRYGNFYQLVKETENGHISIAIETESDPIEVHSIVERHISTWKK